jgi:hypothetical protein
VPSKKKKKEERKKEKNEGLVPDSSPGLPDPQN